MKWLKKHVAAAPPRRVEVRDKQTFLLFLDGACEGGDGQQASIGGVLCDQLGRGLACFGEDVPSDVLAAWRQRNIKQLIFQAETLPYLVSLFLWREVLKDACALVFIDNEAARFSWISGAARNEDVSRKLRRGAFKEAAMNTVPYFCRVPTHSNIADREAKQRSTSSATEDGQVGSPRPSELHTIRGQTQESERATALAGTDPSFTRSILGMDTNRVPQQSPGEADSEQGGKTLSEDDQSTMAERRQGQAPMRYPQMVQVLQTRLMNRRNQCYLNALTTCLHRLSLAARRSVGALAEVHPAIRTVGALSERVAKADPAT